MGAWICVGTGAPSPKKGGMALVRVKNWIGGGVEGGRVQDKGIGNKGTLRKKREVLDKKII